jgi:hypothetical protein
MSVENFPQFVPHDVARSEVEAWRGECLDLFAQGEAMIGALLELAMARNFEVRLHPLAVQRTLEAERLVELVGGSEIEVEDAGKALADWQTVESRGELLAHGTITEALDRHGNWHAIIDTVTYRAGKANKGRWAVSQAETEDFRKQLGAAFNRLKAQLGCVRLRLGS